MQCGKQSHQSAFHHSGKHLQCQQPNQLNCELPAPLHLTRAKQPFLLLKEAQRITQNQGRRCSLKDLQNRMLQQLLLHHLSLRLIAEHHRQTNWQNRFHLLPVNNNLLLAIQGNRMKTHCKQCYQQGLQGL